MKTKPRACSRRWFTLIELLVVMAIIMVLAGLVLGVAAAVSRSSAEAKTKAQLEQIVLALQEYHQDRGYYPQLSGAASGWVDFSISIGDFKHTQTGRVYLDGFSGGSYNDGWGKPFRYTIAAAEVGSEGYRLRSPGRDEVEGNEDDICSWKQR